MMPSPGFVHTPAGWPDQLMTLDTLAQYAAVSRRTLEKAIRDPVHPLPFKRIGAKGVRVRKSDFDRWLEEEQARTAPPPTGPLTDDDVAVLCGKRRRR